VNAHRVCCLFFVVSLLTVKSHGGRASYVNDSPVSADAPEIVNKIIQHQDTAAHVKRKNPTF
jgi:hypothetical protein